MNETLDLNRFHDIEDLRRVMKALRDKETGCPWDSVQTHERIRQDCLEEAYEVCDAIDRNDMDDLKEELGDLLLQVVFHSAMEEEKGNFSFDDVCNTVATKMIQRHPHVFKDREEYIGAEKYDLWETAKREEHGQLSTADAVDGVAHTLPSVWRLSKMVKKDMKSFPILVAVPISWFNRLKTGNLTISEKSIPNSCCLWYPVCMEQSIWKRLCRTPATALATR